MNGLKHKGVLVRPFVLVLLLFACGCVSVPQRDMATYMSSCECESVVGAEGFLLGDWPKQSWWEDFEDPILTDLIESALQLNPTLQEAEASLKAASQVAIQRRAAFFPEVDLDANTNWQHLSKDGFYRAFAPTIPAVVNDITVGLSYFYEFDFWGKNRALFNAALGQARAFAAERLQSELILTTSIAYTYAEMQYYLRKAQILQSIEDNNRAIEDIRDKRQKYALDNALLPLGAKSTKLDSQSALIEVEKEILERVHKLKALSGIGQDADLDIHFHPLNPLTFVLPEELGLDLIARRPDLIAQKARAEAAAKEMKAAKTDFYPNVNVKGLVGFESVQWSTLFESNNYSGNIQPAIHLPIFTAGRIRARYKEKAEIFNQAVFAYNSLVLQAAQDVADKVTDISQLQKEIEVRKNSLQTAEKQAELTLRRFENAIDDEIAVLNAMNAVLESELSLATLEYGQQLSGILLIRALGGGYYD